MPIIINKLKGKEFYIVVNKDNWIIEQYKKYGFKFYNEHKDDRFMWMKKK